MKAIKLLLVFILVLGGVVGVLYLVSDDPGTTIAVPENDAFSYVSDQIDSTWAGVQDWDESVFNKNWELIKQNQHSFNVGPLKEKNTLAAVRIIHDKLVEQWGMATCKKSVIDGYMKGISYICEKDEGASTIPLVQEIQEIHRVYKSAYTLATSRLRLKPAFDAGQISWNSYDDYCSEKTRARSSLLNNSYYRTYLSEITVIKNGLAAVPDKLADNRAIFYKDLAETIIAHYKRIPSGSRTSDQLSDLRSARNRYNAEYTPSTALNNFASDFSYDVYNNEDY